MEGGKSPQVLHPPALLPLLGRGSAFLLSSPRLGLGGSGGCSAIAAKGRDPAQLLAEAQ